jgi:hypothetical protein
MMNYPFQDNFGTVDSVLIPDHDSAHPILRMTSPARRRWAQHVFEDMCVGRTKLRVVDIPEALKACDLPVSPELTKAIKQFGTRGQDNTEATIDGNQWYAIVNRYVRRQRILAVAKGTGNDSDVINKLFKNNITDESSSTDSIITMPSLLEGIMDGKDSVTENDAVAAEKRSRATDMREGQRSQIRQDRSRFYLDKVRQEKAALSAVGERRIKTLTENNLGKREADPKRSVWRDPAFAYGRSKAGAAANVSATMKAKSLAARRNLPLGRWADLESGTAALEIADAFLGGSVGRELTDPSSFMYRGRRSANSDMDEEDIIDIVDTIESKNRRESKATARSQAEYLLHGNRYSDKETRSAAVTELGFGHRTTRDRECEQSMRRDARSLYSQGWRSSKGGWVADFGLPHTHTLNRDEDFEYAHSLSQIRDNYYKMRNDHKQKQSLDGPEVEGVDNYTMSVANTILAPTNEFGLHQRDDQNYSFSTVRSPKDRIASLRQEFGLHGDLKVSPNDRNLSLHSEEDDDDNDGSENSDATPVNINRPSHHDAGSDDNPVVNVDSDTEDSSLGAGGRLLSKLQSSMSVRVNSNSTE